MQSNKLIITIIAVVVIAIIAFFAFNQYIYNEKQVDDTPTEVSWEQAVAIVNSGEVEMVFQSHALEVRLTLDNGQVFVTTEPEIDDIFEVVRACGAKCKDIILATE